MKKKLIKRAITLLTVICTAITIINIAYNFLLPLFLSYKFKFDLNKASSVGIIGGADGPTTIYLASSQSSHFVSIIIALLSILGITYLIYMKRKDKQKEAGKE